MFPALPTAKTTIILHRRSQLAAVPAGYIALLTEFNRQAGSVACFRQGHGDCRISSYDMGPVLAKSVQRRIEGLPKGETADVEFVFDPP